MSRLTWYSMIRISEKLLYDILNKRYPIIRTCAKHLYDTVSKVVAAAVSWQCSGHDRQRDFERSAKQGV